MSEISLYRVAELSLRERVRSLDIQRELGVSVEVVWASCQDAFLRAFNWGFSEHTPIWEETPR